MKSTSVWECQQCGSQFPKWAGKCPECGKWNSLVETVVSVSGRGAAPGAARVADVKPRPWQQFQSASAKLYLPTSIGELDRVLGGGLVAGGVILMAGEPGIGKSTLLSHLALQTQNTLYINGEESSLQVAARFRRLEPNSDNQVVLYPQTNVEAVLEYVEKAFQKTRTTPRTGESRPEADAPLAQDIPRDSENQTRAVRPSDRLTFRPSDAPRIPSFPNLLIVDSIQVMSSSKLRSSAGAIGQIRETAARLIEVAKRKNMPAILVGHFTKEGEVAGPKVLEHMVDTVLVMEGDRSGNLRLLRCLKNRFGPVDEVGIFSMTEGGMAEVKNPAELLIGQFGGQAAGSVLGCVLEGQRPLVLEVQALVVPTKLAVPRRVSHGINQPRLQLLCAVIEKHVARRLGEMDVYINIAGGLRSSDPGLDLAVVAAIVSSLTKTIEDRKSKVDKSNLSSTLDPHHPSSIIHHLSSLLDTPIFCGEVGLLGEVRPVQGWQRREKEMERLGMGKLVGSNLIKSVRELQKFL